MKGKEIDILLEKGKTNSELVKLGYSLSTVKYRRARMFRPKAYKNIIKRCVINNKIYRKKLSTGL